MNIQLDGFDSSNVGDLAKRLAWSFNIAAHMGSGANPLEPVESIFKGTTGLDSIPSFNEDEQKYLELKLVEFTALVNHGRLYGISDLSDEAQVMKNTAYAMNLIPKV